MLLCDTPNKCHLLDYASKKSRRVVRSIMGGELYVGSDAFNVSRTLLIVMRNALGNSVLRHIFTDSKQVFDVVTSGKHPTERHLAIDVSTVGKAYARREIDCVGLLCDKDNPVDAMSKLGSSKFLMELVENGVSNMSVQEWIVRIAENKPAIESAGSVYVHPECPSVREGSY